MNKRKITIALDKKLYATSKKGIAVLALILSGKLLIGWPRKRASLGLSQKLITVIEIYCGNSSIGMELNVSTCCRSANIDVDHAQYANVYQA